MNKRIVVCVFLVAALSFAWTSCSKDDNIDSISEGSESEIYDDEEGDGDPLLAEAGVAVDLGLPSGTLWADRNVGASSVGEYGDFFSWGGTTAHSPLTYGWDDYEFVTPQMVDGYPVCCREYINKYQLDDGMYQGIWYKQTGYDQLGVPIYEFVGDGKSKLDLEDDAARVNWGGKWRIPTIAQFEELINNCTWVWTNDFGGLAQKGFYVHGLNGNSLFFPFAGWYEYGWDDNAEVVGKYRTSELSWGGTDCVGVMICQAGGACVEWNGNRVVGYSIRPVCFPSK